MTENQKAFVAKIGAAAREDMRVTGILASLTIAQAICESGWGASGLTRAANNLFGIKGSYNGRSVQYPTQEYINGRYVKIKAQFKSYPDWPASINDHSALFLRLDRYANLRGETDYREACRKVAADGYATSPTYTTTLVKLIEDYDLTVWDKPAAATASDGMVRRRYDSVWASTNLDAAVSQLASAQAQEPKSFMLYCADGKYRIYQPSATSTSAGAEALMTSPDSIVKIEQ